MDGRQRQLNRSESLQRRLSWALGVAILVVAVLAGGFSFVSAFHAANALQDDTLHQVAALFDRQRLAPHQEQDHGQSPAPDEETRVVVQHLSEGTHATGDDDTGPVLPLPEGLPDGLQTLEVAGETFRVLVATTDLGKRIAVSQETAVRNANAQGSALRTLVPLLVLVPVLLLLVADLVKKMFSPLAALSADIDGRAGQDLQPVEETGLPSEVRPFAAAINRLLLRVDSSMQAQRRFVADAAHELRSPLTALSLQAERLAEVPLSEPARERLGALRQGIARGRNLLEQLLSLARAQAAPTVNAAALPGVSLQHICRRVLEDLLPLAEARHIDLGVEGSEDAQVQASETELLTVARNLVDNAIRYTPVGGKIDLSVSREKHCAVLTVADSGPGIALQERERIFDPFYRTPGSGPVGSGLGLAIVQAVVQRLNGHITLDFSDVQQGCGLRVAVHFPLPGAL